MHSSNDKNEPKTISTLHMPCRDGIHRNKSISMKPIRPISDTDDENRNEHIFYDKYAFDNMGDCIKLLQKHNIVKDNVYVKHTSNVELENKINNKCLFQVLSIPIKIIEIDNNTHYRHCQYSKVKQQDISDSDVTIVVLHYNNFDKLKSFVKDYLDTRISFPTMTSYKYCLKDVTSIFVGMLMDENRWNTSYRITDGLSYRLVMGDDLAIIGDSKECFDGMESD